MYRFNRLPTLQQATLSALIGEEMSFRAKCKENEQNGTINTGSELYFAGRNSGMKQQKRMVLFRMKNIFGSNPCFTVTYTVCTEYCTVQMTVLT